MTDLNGLAAALSLLNKILFAGMTTALFCLLRVHDIDRTFFCCLNYGILRQRIISVTGITVSGTIRRECVVLMVANDVLDRPLVSTTRHLRKSRIWSSWLRSQPGVDPSHEPEEGLFTDGSEDGRVELAPAAKVLHSSFFRELGHKVLAAQRLGSQKLELWRRPEDGVSVDLHRCVVRLGPAVVEDFSLTTKQTDSRVLGNAGTRGPRFEARRWRRHDAVMFYAIE